MTEFSAAFRFKNWLDALQDEEKDPEWIYLLENEALVTYNQLLSEVQPTKRNSSDSLSSNVIERMNDLYIELNQEKRFSLELTEKLKTVESELVGANLKIQSLTDELLSLNDKNARLTSDNEFERVRLQRIREDLYADGERAQVLSRVATDNRDETVKKLEDKLTLLRQRIIFLEQKPL